MKQQNTTTPVTPIEKEVERLAKEHGYPHQKLDHATYIKVLQQAHKNIFQSPEPVTPVKDEGHTPGKLSWRAWGETITISNFEGDTVHINPHGNKDAGIPSREDKEVAERVIETWNGYDALKARHQKLMDDRNFWEVEAIKNRDANKELIEVLRLYREYVLLYGKPPLNDAKAHEMLEAIQKHSK